ncbi:hypothetical protein Tco_0030820 [Tanacetum coccineum]
MIGLSKWEAVTGALVFKNDGGGLWVSCQTDTRYSQFMGSCNIASVAIQYASWMEESGDRESSHHGATTNHKHSYLLLVAHASYVPPSRHSGTSSATADCYSLVSSLVDNILSERYPLGAHDTSVKTPRSQ